MLRNANFLPGFAAFEQGFHHLLHLVPVAQGGFAGRVVQDAVDKVPGNAIPRFGWARNIHVDIVRHPVLGLEQLERAELRAGLVSEQFDLQLIGLVRRPETLDLKARAIFKADKAAGVIVRSVLLVRALRHLPKTPIAPAARAELRAAHPCHRNGLGHAEQVPHLRRTLRARP